MGSAQCEAQRKRDRIKEIVKQLANASRPSIGRPAAETQPSAEAPSHPADAITNPHWKDRKQRILEIYKESAQNARHYEAMRSAAAALGATILGAFSAAFATVVLGHGVTRSAWYCAFALVVGVFVVAVTEFFNQAHRWHWLQMDAFREAYLDSRRVRTRLRQDDPITDFDEQLGELFEQVHQLATFGRRGRISSSYGLENLFLAPGVLIILLGFSALAAALTP